MSVQSNPFRPVTPHAVYGQSKTPIQSKSILFGNAHKITFGDGDHYDTETQRKISAEETRLASELPPLHWTAKSIIKDKNNDYGKLIVNTRSLIESTFRDRAVFNVTNNPDVLDKYLPYRQRLQGSAKKSYDDLVQKVLKNAQFSETDNNIKLYKALDTFQQNRGKKPFFLIRWAQNVINSFKNIYCAIRSLTSPDYRRKFGREGGQKMQEQGRAISEENLSAFLKEQVKTDEGKSDRNYSFDKSSQYLFAAGVAELLHKKPDAVDTILKAEIDGKQRPLRLIIAKGRSCGGIGGQYRFGMNTIWVNQLALWGRAAKDQYNIGQHEFVHALSENAEREALPEPLMNPEQKRRFLALREKFVNHYYKNDMRWFDTALCISGTNETSSGLPYYAFMNNMEFLTVSLDSFKNTPEKLRRTEAGQDLYELYKEIFNIDPLNDFKKTEPAETLEQKTKLAKTA